jgi:hypothetical protein
MGLDIAVGLLSELEAEDPEGADYHRGVIGSLNEVLSEAGHPPHSEPVGLPSEQTYSAQMWGYGGLHHVRRLAASLALEKRLPLPCSYEEASNDPILDRFYSLHERFRTSKSRSGLSALFRKAPEKPPFEHLILHSDAEGFYLPRQMESVVFDNAQPQRSGLGAMVGSSVALLDECRNLAAALGIPEGIDPEADEVWENAENPPGEGQPWQRFGVETFVLTRCMPVTFRNVLVRQSFLRRQTPLC